MPTCVVKSCKNYIGKLKKPQGISFHAFPRNTARKDEWIQIIRKCRGESGWNPSSASTVCSAHFDDEDFKTTAKGLRCLFLNAIPKRLLSDLPEIETETITSSLPTIMEAEIEKTVIEYCRLCAAADSGGKLISLQTDDVMKNLVVKMINRLNINTDFEHQHLPTTICSACIKALYTAYDFVIGTDLAQITLNNLSKYKCSDPMADNDNLHCKPDISNTSVQQISTNQRVEAYVIEQPLLPVIQVSSRVDSDSSELEQPLLVEPSSTYFYAQDSPRKRKDNLKILNKKKLVIESQKKNIKILNQKVRRLQNRNDSLKRILKNRLHEDVFAADLFKNLDRKKSKKVDKALSHEEVLPNTNKLFTNDLK